MDECVRPIEEMDANLQVNPKLSVSEFKPAAHLELFASLYACTNYLNRNTLLTPIIVSR